MISETHPLNSVNRGVYISNGPHFPRTLNTETGALGCIAH